MMFGLDPLQISTNERSGMNIYFSEFIATFGLLITILGVRKIEYARCCTCSWIIFQHILVYPSTSFANPAVTFAGAFSDTFTVINPEFILPFIVSANWGFSMLFMNFIESDGSHQL